MPVNIDEDSQLPTYDNVKFLGANKIPFILLLVVIIVIYIFLFTFLNNMVLDPLHMCLSSILGLCLLYKSQSFHLA
jgi:hypothetical protein